jgi:hypothetical protein
MVVFGEECRNNGFEFPSEIRSLAIRKGRSWSRGDG